MEDMRNNNSASLMKEIMTYDFAINEIVLFLDVNPNDLKALEMYEALVKKFKQLKEEYNCLFGPLTNKDNMSKTDWAWLKGPWPWEN